MRSTPSAACRSAATITLRSSFAAIRWVSKATIWCFKNRPIRTPRRFSPTCPAPQLCLIEVAGAFGRDLSAQGEAAMIDFAANWLAGLYGSEVKKAVGRKHATRWNAEPYALGAWSAAAARRRNSRAGNCWSRSPTMSGMPAKRRTRLYGAPWAAPGNPANAPPMRCCAGSDRARRRRRRKPKAKPKRKPLVAASSAVSAREVAHTKASRDITAARPASSRAER